MITHEITLEMRKEASLRPPRVTVRQGESGTEAIEASITLDGEAYESGCESVRLDILHREGTWARVAAEKSGSTVSVTLPSEALSGSGLCRLAHFVFYDADGDVEKTGAIELLILPGVDTSGAAAKSYDNDMDALYKKWLAYEEEAEAQESARVSAESARVSNENTRVSNEKTRVSQETARVSAEKDRASAETTRQGQETTRQNQEAARVKAESDRVDAENARVKAEQTRADQEVARVKAESDRKTAEEEREANEKQRTANEVERKNAEAERVETAAAAVANANNAATAANEAAQKVPEVVTVAESGLFAVKEYKGRKCLFQVIG